MIRGDDDDRVLVEVSRGQSCQQARERVIEISECSIVRILQLPADLGRDLLLLFVEPVSRLLLGERDVEWLRWQVRLVGIEVVDHREEGTTRFAVQPGKHTFVDLSRAKSP